MIDTFSCITIDLPHLIFKEELDISNAFPVKEFLLKFNEIDAAVRFFTLTTSLHKMSSFLRNDC